MEIDLKKGIGSLTDFARNTRRRAREIQRGGKPRVLTQNGEAALVVMSVKAYEELAAHAYEHRMDLRLREALEEYQAGDRGRPAEAAFRGIRKNTRIRRKRASR